jgi:uncharacterized membrane protein YeaQ/YmgE (transglycosylase-associated protein family)
VTIPGVYRPVQQTLSRPEAQPTQTPRGVTVDWLGVRFAGTRDLPPLVLTNVRTAGPGDWYVYVLDYMRADDPSSGRASGSAVRLLVGPRRPWNPPQVPRGPCWARHEITLPHGRASIFMGFESIGDVVVPCPTRPYDRFMALAYLGQTMVFVDAGDAIDHSQWPILYNTREGMEVVVRALRPRVPAKGETAMPVAAHPGPPLSPVWLIAFLIVGAFAGALAALLMHEGGYGLASDMLVGIIGALLGGLLQPRGFLSDQLDVDRALLTASIVACVLIALKIALVHTLGARALGPQSRPRASPDHLHPRRSPGGTGTPTSPASCLAWSLPRSGSRWWPLGCTPTCTSASPSSPTSRWSWN